MLGVLRTALASFCFLLLVSSAHAADPLLDAEAKALGFLKGQKFTLDQISRLYPDLKSDVDLVAMEFASRFGHAEDNLAAAITEVIGAEHTGTVLRKIDEGIARIALPTQRTEAEAFITLVRDRAAGNIENPFRRTIIAYEYRNRPAQEFADGYRQTFSVKGHPKSNGTDFRISVPASWEIYEGERPHVVQNFKTLTRAPYATYNIVIADLNGDPEIAAMPLDQPLPIGLDDLAAMVPDGATLISSKMTTLENRPSGIIVYDWPQDRMGVKTENRAHVVVTTSGHSLIVMTGLAGGLDAATRDRHWTLFEPLFLMIANSFVDNLAYH